MAQPNEPSAAENLVDEAVAQGGAYEIIRKRLVEQGKQLSTETFQLNQARLKEFGATDIDVVARVRVRTENNCIARDIVQVGEHLLFGYNVFIGLKKETKIEDVFALFDVVESDGNFEMKPVSMAGSFLAQSGFVNDFEELYRYYKHTKLVQLTIKNGRLLAGFQIGERLEDIRVFRWSVSADGKDIQYIDNRGERDIQLPPAYDFEWIETHRDHRINGRHPHVNILDSIFVETINGDLTIKVENNTEDGFGIYREPVEDQSQSLDDAKISYAQVGSLILLKILPYREEQWRFIIFNTLSQEVLRVDAIGQSCVQLPEDHGIIFPGGYYLQSGEYKSFEGEENQLTFKRAIKSPNGEDVLFVFYDPEEGSVGLFFYNLINKELQNPIYGHGYALAEDGQLIIFSAENEPTRIHPMQIWTTPYVSDEFASQVPASQTFLGKIGNAELVRGVSDLYSVHRMLEKQDVSSRLYEEISKSAKKIFDDHYWIESDDTKAIFDALKNIAATSELVIDEFEKVQSIRQQSVKALLDAQKQQQTIIQEVRPDNWQTAEEYVDALGKIRRQRGHLITIKEYRYIDVAKIESLNTELDDIEGSLSQQTVSFLSDDKAIEPYLDKIDSINKEIEQAQTIAVLNPLIEIVEGTASGLDLLSELMGSLKVQDPTVRTKIIDAISQVYSKLNQTKARASHKQKSLGSEEAIAQFGAQFKLFSQSITNALGLATTPDKCDEQLSRLLIQLEELESQFSDFDQFIADILDKREEIYESFESHKQRLLDEQQRKAQSVFDASSRILSSIEKRSLKFTKSDELNTYFASDSLVMKIREQADVLRDLGSEVKADDIDARFKAIKEQAIRSLRDKSDIYEAGGSIIKLGPRHKFSVNTQELDLTILPRDGELNVHLTGTNYFEPITQPELLALKDYWDMSSESETPQVYRSEYLAFLILQSARSGESGLSLNALNNATSDSDKLNKLVQEYAAPRYKEGYEKGVHDHDAVLILSALVPAIERAEELSFDPICRALAQVYWANIKGKENNRQANSKNDDVLSYSTWIERAQSARQMQSVFSSNDAINLLAQEIEASITQFLLVNPINVTPLDIKRAASYLVAELSRERLEFISSKYATELVEELKRSLDETSWRQYQGALKKMLGFPAQRWNLTQAWLDALIRDKKLDHLTRYIPEAIALINADERISRRETQADLELCIEGLLGDHRLLENQKLSFAIDAFLQRLEHHQQVVVPAYQQYLKVRQNIITT